MIEFRSLFDCVWVHVPSIQLAKFPYICFNVLCNNGLCNNEYNYSTHVIRNQLFIFLFIFRRSWNELVPGMSIQIWHESSTNCFFKSCIKTRIYFWWTVTVFKENKRKSNNGSKIDHVVRYCIRDMRGKFFVRRRIISFCHFWCWILILNEPFYR